MNMEIKDIENLVNLCRIELSEDEKKELLGEMDSVLGFVDQIQKVKIEDLKTEAGELRNIMREDENPYAGGEFTDDILAEVPDNNTQDGYVKVKKIL
ncbi:MAG: Asp-tRNA(Asn)/Glu-tRNA(Gln) amidotransferase subunit GatC [Candidatus Pacebacteria bacterium]|nr:Asp-tRNA(Asn)/Glu-tRNA(Gln) amidotransferase subunit GatC [Candidatus Paceibacterota bacterium]